jgi:nucleoside-diphosphate-sugar epimerase
MAINDGRVVSNFIVQALQNSDITIYGDGMQTRSFCYVDDLIEGFIKLFFADKIYEPINLGNPQPITMLKLAEEIIGITGSSSKIVFKSLPEDDPKDRRPDISKAKELLNWEPKMNRAEGLDLTAKYFRNLLS